MIGAITGAYILGRCITGAEYDGRCYSRCINLW